MMWYCMMRACWREHAEERPTFLYLRQWLEEMIADCSGVHYLHLDLNPARDYYTCRDSTPNTTSSSVVEDSPFPLSPLFGTDSGPEVDSSNLEGEEAEEVDAASSPERKLTTSHEWDSLTSLVNSDIIVHKELSPVVSGDSSASSGALPTASPSSVAKSVRFCSSRVQDQSEDTRQLQDPDSHGERWSEKHNTSLEPEENTAWNLANESCSPIPSPDAACDEVFTMDLRDKDWFVSSLLRPGPRTGQPRVFPQERHPCSLFRASVTSEASSISDDLIMPLMARHRVDPLDSQGESIYTSSSSSGESFCIPLSQHEMFPHPRPLTPISSCSTDQGSRSSSLRVPKHAPPKSVCGGGQKRQSNVYQHSPSQQRRVRGSILPGKADQAGKGQVRGSTAVLKKLDRDLRRPIVFTKTVPSSSTEVTAL